MSDISRRNFLKTALLASLAATIPLKVAEMFVEKANILEITFFGTGLNIITSQARPKMEVELDGALKFVCEESRPVIALTQIVPIVSGLQTGIHTCRIKSSKLELYGYEVLGHKSFGVSRFLVNYKGNLNEIR